MGIIDRSIYKMIAKCEDCDVVSFSSSISVNCTTIYSTSNTICIPKNIYPQLSLNLITNVFYEQECRCNINYCFNEKEAEWMKSA